MKLSEIITRLGSSPADAVRQSDGYVIICPAHDDHDPSLRITVAENGNLLVRCRAGCATSAIMLSGGLSFHEAQPVENDLSAINTVNDVGQPVALVEQATMAAYTKVAAGALSEGATDYLKRRFGVTADMAQLLGIGVDDGSIEYNRLAQGYHDEARIVVPFKDFEGVIRGFQGRDMSGNARVRWSGPSNPPEGTWLPYGFYPSGSGLDYVVITEGPGDALTACAAGFDAVGIRGAGLARRTLPHLTDGALDGRLVVLAGDNDDSGRVFNETLAAGLSAAGVEVYQLQFPDGIKDVADWFESDPDSFVNVFQVAVAAARSPESVQELLAEEAQRDLDRYAQLYTTEQGLATVLQDHLGDRLLHSPGLGFFLYRDGCWERDTLNRVRLMAHEVARLLYERGEAHTPVDDTDRLHQHLFAGARKLRSTSTLNQVLVELAALVNVEATRFDQEKDLLCVANGTVNLRTSELLEHSPDHLITHRINLNYDPSAKWDKWQQFLVDIMPDERDRMLNYIQRLVGYGVTGHTYEQAFAVLWGRGANGKSVFTDTLARVFEPITVTTPFSTFEKKPSGSIPNDLAALRGSRLVMASEGGAGNTMAEDVIKRVTGQDLISARFMREEFFSFRPTFLIMLATNHKPSFRGQDEGLWRRVKLIPFNRYFAPDERDHHLAEKLAEEAEGILSWAVAGAAMWYESGLEEPPLVTKATDSYREVMDALAGFYPGVLVPESGGCIRGADAYSAYRDWCYAEGVADRNVWTNRAFYAAMEERGIFRKKFKDGIRLMGVSLAEGVSSVEDTEKEGIWA